MSAKPDPLSGLLASQVDMAVINQDAGPYLKPFLVVRHYFLTISL